MQFIFKYQYKWSKLYKFTFYFPQPESFLKMECSLHSQMTNVAFCILFVVTKSRKPLSPKR